MPNQPNMAAKCWKLEAWPTRDQAAWQHHILAGDPFDDAPGHHGATLRGASLTKIVKGYGRWLSFLDSRGWLDLHALPLERVTVPRLRAYVRTLIRSGNRPYTVIGRVNELAMAMAIMAPGHDIGWIRKPDGVTIYTLLRKRQKRVRVPASAQLYRWGLELMRGTDLSNLTLESMLAYRDGLIVAIFAARARRLKSMAAVCVDEELLKKDGLYRIELKPEQVKTNRPDEFWLPHALVPYVDAYLAMVRPALAAGHNHAALFVGQSGRALTSKGLAIRISVLSQRKFGYSFGPHAFRHALSTMLAEYDPANPGLAAGVLGIGPDVNARHYDRAKQSVAARSYSDLIDRKRIQLRLNIKR